MEGPSPEGLVAQHLRSWIDYFWKSVSGFEVNRLEGNQNGTGGEPDDDYTFSFTTEGATINLDGYVTDADTTLPLEQSIPSALAV